MAIRFNKSAYQIGFSTFPQLQYIHVWFLGCNDSEDGEESTSYTDTDEDMNYSQSEMSSTDCEDGFGGKLLD